MLVEEDGSEVAARLWAEADLVVVCRHDGSGARQARASWEAFWSAIRVVELSDEIADAAAALVDRLVLGGADAVHLASALALSGTDPVLAAWDRRLHLAASQAGLRVAPMSL